MTAEAVDADEQATETVEERVMRALDADEFHGVVSTRRQDDAVYLVVGVSRSWGDVSDDAVAPSLDVLDLRTVVVDPATYEVRPTDNGLWVPRDVLAADHLGGVVDAAANHLAGGDADDYRMDASGEVDAAALLQREVEREQDSEVDGDRSPDRGKLRRHPGVSESREWGYGGGAPPEVAVVVSRLTEAGLDPSEHLFRLKFGKKEPFDAVDGSRSPPSRGVPVDELRGNYGVDCLSRDSGLVAVDVDYPEEFPEDALPETFSISSPHGDDSRRHLLYVCREKDRLADEIGAWSTQAPEWGDLWAGANRYVVGAGSQLSAYGCNRGDYEVGDADACEVCSDEAGGFYRVVADRPIAEVDADALLDVLPDSGEVEGAGNPVAADLPESGDTFRCAACGAEHESEEAVKSFDGGSRHVCRGGCG